MITGQLSKPLLPLRAEMEGAELQEDERAASPDSETNDEPLLLPPDADDNDKLYAEFDRIWGKLAHTHSSVIRGDISSHARSPRLRLEIKMREKQGRLRGEKCDCCVESS
ncbi:hypothetical protein MHYP_G00290530 [Metynnis hypsauchen]